VIVEGKAVGDFQLKTGVTAKGRPYQLVVGKVLSGATFVNVTSSLEPGESPILPSDGDEIRAFVVPNFKANGVLNLDVKMGRPVIAEVKK
jgi:hypothetical protein